MNSTPRNARMGPIKLCRRGSLGEAEYCFPATIAQQGFQYLDNLEWGNPSWNIAVRFRIRGPLQVPLLERALNDLVQRHEILRTTFVVIDDVPVQIVHSEAVIPLPVEDLSDRHPAEREQEEESLTIEEGSRRFDLSAGPLIRALLLRLGADDHMLLITVHHIVSDGWSIGVISDDLAEFYKARFAQREPALAALPFQFADYAVWKSERTAGSALDNHRVFWKEKLARLPICEIPPDHSRPPIKTHNGYILSVVLPKKLTDALERYAHSLDCTFFSVALAALLVVIRQHAKQDDVVVGTLLAGRERLELEPMVGLFINTVVLRTDLSGDPTIPELVSRVRKVAEEALVHQELHFQQLVELLRPKRDLSRPPLYSINFIYQRDFVKPLEFAGLALEPYPSKSPGAIYDLNFFMVQRADGWRFSCEYNCDLYEASTVNMLISQVRSIFEQIAALPSSRISTLSFTNERKESLPPSAPSAPNLTQNVLGTAVSSHNGNGLNGGGFA
jgi:hypothetical protein